ncbi:MAG: TldD/PmbA family protein, partial [Candidatus Bathyarchaeia archaeon]
MLKDTLVKVVNTAVDKFGAEHVEVRAQKVFKTMLTIKEERVEAAKEGIENGAAIRVLVNGAWGFASSCLLDTKTLVSAASEACRMAKVAGQKLKNPIKLAENKAFKDDVSAKPKRDPSKISIEDKIKITSTIAETVLGYDQRVKSCTIDYLDLVGTSYFLNSEGSCIKQDKLYVWSRILVTAREGDVFTFSREEVGSTSGFEVFDVETPEIIGERVVKRAVEQLKAKPPKGGTFPVVLGPNVVGVFIHEAFGHLAEADL